MDEELLEFENTIEDDAGHSHVATVLGREREDGLWIGWLRFRALDPQAGATVLETGRETTQPNRKDLRYWASGLTYFYLQGALARARRRAAVRVPAADAGVNDGVAGRRPRTAPSGRSAGPEGGRRLDVVGADDHVAGDVMGVRAPRTGTVRELPDMGMVIYEGVRGDAHAFSVHFATPNQGATLANWLFSRLHRAGAAVRVDGRAVPLTNDGLCDALVGPVP